MRTISIITPLYHGNKFLTNLLRNINACAETLDKDLTVEWVISNDSPDDPADISTLTIPSYIKCKCLQTEVNRGIHGARVKGFKASHGDYIVFLDQDDELMSNYLVSQLEHIGDADAVVCECSFDGHPFYNGIDRPDIEKCLTKEYLIKQKNGFVPGQTLIKRESIPEVWQRRLMKTNCCDDQYLWIAMLAKGCKFAANRETKYFHYPSGSNQSKNLSERFQSNMEMMEILSSEKILSEDELYDLRMSRDAETINYLKQNASQKTKISIYRKLLSFYEEKEDIIFDFSNLKGKIIAVYGADLGTHLIPLMHQKGITVKYIVDRNKEYENKINDSTIRVLSPENISDEIELVINTVLMDKEKVRDFLTKSYPKIEIVEISDLLGIK